MIFRTNGQNYVSANGSLECPQKKVVCLKCPPRSRGRYYFKQAFDATFQHWVFCYPFLSIRLLSLAKIFRWQHALFKSRQLHMSNSKCHLSTNNNNNVMVNPYNSLNTDELRGRSCDIKVFAAFCNSCSFIYFGWKAKNYNHDVLPECSSHLASPLLN